VYKNSCSGWEWWRQELTLGLLLAECSYSLAQLNGMVISRNHHCPIFMHISILSSLWRFVSVFSNSILQLNISCITSRHKALIFTLIHRKVFIIWYFKYAQLLFYWMQSYETFTDPSTPFRKWLQLATPNWVIRWCHMRWMETSLLARLSFSDCRFAIERKYRR
jgi:hypothetical protein